MQNLTKTWLIILLTMVSTSLAAAPYGYSINSDDGSEQYHDGLYRIDLDTGEDTRVGTVLSNLQTRLDVEGLAFAPNGVLYGIDDETLRLFPIDPNTAKVDTENEVFLTGSDLTIKNNDFGLTFACDDELYATSVAKKALYRIELDGTVHLIGSTGVNIVAIAAYGNNPVQLYGLGHGDGSANLYKINAGNGSIEETHALTGSFQPYTEGGLSFDDDGELWAITDRSLSLTPQASQILKINKSNGAVTVESSTSAVGFESLAVTVPRGCATGNGDEIANFHVRKIFADYNENLPATLNINCNDGIPGDDTMKLFPANGMLGHYFGTFVQTTFTSGRLECEVSEEPIDNYTAEYECFSEDGTCTVSENGCLFTGVKTGQNDICVVRNYPDPVEITVEAEWVYDEEDIIALDPVVIILECRDVSSGDGTWDGSDMTWHWLFSDGSDPQVAHVAPLPESTECRTVVRSPNSAIESTGNCQDWVPVYRGDPPLTCLVTNTLFFKGVPTLSQYGLMLIAALMLLTGMAATRRF